MFGDPTLLFDLQSSAPSSGRPTPSPNANINVRPQPVAQSQSHADSTAKQTTPSPPRLPAPAAPPAATETSDLNIPIVRAAMLRVQLHFGGNEPSLPSVDDVPSRQSGKSHGKSAVLDAAKASTSAKTKSEKRNEPKTKV